MGPATIVLVFGARYILRIYGGGYIAHTVVLFQLLALSLFPFCIETIAFSLDRIAGKPLRATLRSARPSHSHARRRLAPVRTVRVQRRGRRGLRGGCCRGAVASRVLAASAAARRQPDRPVQSGRSQCRVLALRPTRAACRIAGVTRAVTGQEGQARTISGSAAGTRVASCKRRRPVHAPACTGRRRVSPSNRPDLVRSAAGADLLERAPDGVGHPGLLLVGYLRVKRKRQQLPRGSLGDREVAGPVAECRKAG